LKFSDGKTAVFPLSWYSNRQTFYSSMPTAYGGLISMDRLDTPHLVAAIDFVQRYLGSLFVRVNPFWDEFDLGATDLPFQADETEVLWLDSGMEKLFKNWTKGHKSAVSKARREGVTIRQASTEQDWVDYFAIYEDSLERWGGKVSSRYKWELFQIMRDCESHNIKLWIAESSGQAIAGALCLYAKKHVVYWHGAALEKHFHLRPVQLLLFEIIANAADNGYRWFDFNPSGGHVGVRAFKRGFGTTTLSTPWIELEGQTRIMGWGSIFKRRFRLWEYVE
jgi:lipid II:glycine glycyltransferase (peptidoglycan interpeptide bridge formation enzyme)